MHAGEFRETGHVIERIRQVLGGIDLDCACRSRISEALLRFSELEQRRAARRELAEARHRRDLIAGILELMRELDDIAWDEPDHGVFTDLALLFEDIADAAHRGATALRGLGETTDEAS